MEYRHKWLCGVVVEKVTREGEVVSSNLAGCVVCEKCYNLQFRWNRCVAGRWGPPRIKSFLFSIFKIGFLKTSLPSPFKHSANSLPCARGKGPLYRRLFAVYHLPELNLFYFLFLKFWKLLCRVLFSTRQTLCRVHVAKDLFTDVSLPCTICRVQKETAGLLYCKDFWSNFINYIFICLTDYSMRFLSLALLVMSSATFPMDGLDE